MKKHLNSWSWLGLAVAAMTVTTELMAATNGFIIPGFRGSAGSEAGYWETFTVASGAPGNLPDQPGATTTAVLTQTDAGALLTGSGNIYDMSVSQFELADTTPFPLGTVVLQARSVGTELDYPSVALRYTNESGAHLLAPLFRYETSRLAVPGQGYGVASLWQWDLTGLALTSFTIVFQASGAHLSFDSLTLDTAEQFAPAFTAQPFAGSATPATLARWMYPFNASPASRPTASVFGSLGSTPDFDSRDAQFLLGWSTTNRVPAGQSATNYLIRRARVTLTIATGNQYAYTGSLRDYRTYFPTNDPRRLAAAGDGSAVELFGAGFRGGYAATNYPQAGPWAVDESGGYYTNRVAYAAGFDLHGKLVDVSNNVGDDGTNELADPFEVAPFAVGQTTAVAEGQLMPLGSQLTFDLNLADPLIYGYVQRGLNEGNLSFVVSSLLGASFSGPANYPNFYTSFSALAADDQFPLLELSGEIVRPGVDGDGDGLPDDWENFYFGSLSHGAAEDGDADGSSLLAEYQAGTNPTNGADAFRLLALEHAADTAELHFTFAPLRQYSVSASDDLQSWQTVTNAPLIYTSAWLAKAGTNLTYPAPVEARWEDLNATNAHRFYRVNVQ